MKLVLNSLLFTATLFSANILANTSMICSKNSHAKNGGHTNDFLVSVNVNHTYAANKTHTFKRQFVVKPSIKEYKCGSANDPYEKLVVVLHGGGGSGCRMRDSLGINVGDKLGPGPNVWTDCINGKKTLYAFPNGLKSIDHPDYDENAGGPLLFDSAFFKGTAENPTSRQYNDGRDPSNLIKESKFIDAIYNKLNGKPLNGNGPMVKFDGSIYLAGHSNGASAQWKILTENKKVKALFLSAGLMPINVANANKFKSQQAHIFMIQARHDGLQDFENGTKGKNLSAFKTIETIAKSYGYGVKPNFRWEYPNQKQTIIDEHGDFMKDAYYGSSPKSYYPPVVGEKVVMLTELGLKKSMEKGRMFGAGHCWHGVKSQTTVVLEGSGESEIVNEQCTGLFSSTFWMIESFKDADKFDER